MKNNTRLILTAVFLAVAGVSLAGEHSKHVMAIEVVGDDDANGVKFSLDLDDPGFKLDEMQVGETRSVVDESGRAVLITRSEAGFSINVDGETIELPLITDIGGEDLHWVTDSGEADVNLQVIRKQLHSSMSDSDGAVFISSQPIDAATRASIQSVLSAAGYDSEIEFVDHSGSEDGQVFIRKIEKVVDAN